MSVRLRVSVYLVCALALAGLVNAALGRRNQAPQQAASNESRKSQVSKPDATGTSCIYDFERGEVPNCLRQAATGQLFVTTEVLKQLHFDSYGLAPVLSPKEGWMYVSRKGKVVIQGVQVMDNGPDSFHDGRVRVVRNNKYGFADRKGQLVIPPAYDGALNFEKGKAKVCNGCVSRCADVDCEHSFFSGGEWFQIDTQGKSVARVKSDN